MMNKVSIITPVLNQYGFIEQCIESVLSQNYANLEYIIIDGGSTDGTREIIKKYSRYLTHWESRIDKGQSHAINKGLKVATGNIFNWLNSDDWYEPGALKIIAENFRDEKVNVVCGREKIVENGKVKRITSGTTICNSLEDTIAAAHIDQPPTFFRKSAVDAIGNLTEDLHYRMESDFWVRYLVAFGLGGVVKIPNVLTNFRLHGESKTCNDIDGFEREKDLIFNSMAKHINRKLTFDYETGRELSSNFKGEEDIGLLNRAIDKFLFRKVRNLYNKRDFSNIKLYLEQINFTSLNKMEKDDLFRLLRRVEVIPKYLFKIHDSIIFS